MKKVYWKNYQNQLFQNFIKKNKYILIFKDPNIKIKEKQNLEIQLKSKNCLLIKSSNKQIDTFYGSLFLIAIQNENQIEFILELINKKNLLGFKIDNKLYNKIFLIKNWKNSKLELINLLNSNSFFKTLNLPLLNLIIITKKK